MAGTNAEGAKKVLEDSGLPILGYVGTMTNSRFSITVYNNPFEMIGKFDYLVMEIITFFYFSATDMDDVAKKAVAALG